MNLKPYVPDFTTAFEHFCIHPGGKAVINEVGKSLKLRHEQTLPMLVPFERYGNTSSSSTWYAYAPFPLSHCAITATRHPVTHPTCRASANVYACPCPYRSPATRCVDGTHHEGVFAFCHGVGLSRALA